MDIAQIKFTATERPMIEDACRGCLFDPEKSTVCHAACLAAKLMGLPDCEYESPQGKRVIYILAPADERQIDIFAGVADE